MSNEFSLAYPVTGATVTCKAYSYGGGVLSLLSGTSTLTEDDTGIYGSDATDIASISMGDAVVYYDGSTIVASGDYIRSIGDSLRLAYPSTGATVTCKAYYNSGGTLTQRVGEATLTEYYDGIYSGDPDDITALAMGDVLVYYDSGTIVATEVYYATSGSNINESVFSILSSSVDVSDIVGTRIYPHVIPQNTSLPAIVYSQIAGIRRHTTSGTDNLVPSRWQFTCVTETYAELRALASAIRTTLDNYSGTVGSVVFQCIHFIDENDLTDVLPGTDALRRYSKAIDFYINYNE